MKSELHVELEMGEVVPGENNSVARPCDETSKNVTCFRGRRLHTCDQDPPLHFRRVSRSESMDVPELNKAQLLDP